MTTRKSNIFILFFAISLALFSLMYAHTLIMERQVSDRLRGNTDLVKKYTLTDLCLFTEANYTRHLSQADIHTAFQDSPASLEHFPTGSMAMPPQAVRKLNEKMD